MSTTAQEYYEHNAEAMKPVRASLPELMKGFAGLHQAAMKPGALDLREKELVAVGIAMTIRCENCINSHVRSAIKAGATRAQVLEAAGVGVMIGGGASYTYLPRIHEAFEALAARGELT